MSTVLMLIKDGTIIEQLIALIVVLSSIYQILSAGKLAPELKDILLLIIGFYFRAVTTAVVNKVRQNGNTN